MKRIGGLYEKIYSVENLRLADSIARKGKTERSDIITYDQNREANILLLHEALKNKTYKTSEYTIFKIFEPKERDIYSLPYYPDRIVHRAVMNIMEPIFVSVFTADTYNCIKNRGIHAAAYAVRDALQNFPDTQFCLKLDIKKFYPNVDHSVLKQLLRRKIKDNDLLWLLDEIIDSAVGLPIGNYLSQYFANFYLTYFDHWIKEEKQVKCYFRYADDMVILAGNKPYLHQILSEIKMYLKERLKLDVKKNYQVFPVQARGIDFVGYKFFHTHTLLRKSIKKNFARMLVNNKNNASIASYKGWAKHCNSRHLLKKLLSDNFVGEKIKVKEILGKKIVVYNYKVENSKIFKNSGSCKCMRLQVSLGDEKRVIFTSSSGLMRYLQKTSKSKFPFKATIIEKERRFEFV